MRAVADLRADYERALRSDRRQCIDGTPLDVRVFGNTETVGHCWEFQGSRSQKMGHGRIALDDGRIRGAHRAAYELAVGPVPDGMCVLHACDNPPCVNPAHLWLGTMADNNHDRSAKGRSRNQWTGPLAKSPPDLADQLHLGGNGLVPQCARAAFDGLLERGGWSL